MATRTLSTDPEHRVLGQRRNVARTAVALAAAALLIAVTAVWGGRLNTTRALRIHAAPLFAYWKPSLAWATAGAIVLAALVCLRGPSVAQRVRFTHLLLIATIVTAAWGLMLALTDGWTGVTRGPSGPHDYLAIAGAAESPGEFLRTFVDRIGSYNVHVRGHPPALVPILWWLERIGLGGPGAAAALFVAGGVSSVPAVLLSVRAVAGEATARRVAPFLILSPAAVWMVTSADALFLGVSAWGATLVILAATTAATTGATTKNARSAAYATAGGLLLGFGLFLSYGSVLVALIPLTVIVSKRRWSVLIAAGAGGAAVIAGSWLLGFWWPAGLIATRAEYADGIAAVRPYGYFVLANLAAFAIVCGPATVAGIARLLDRKLWLLVGAGLSVVVLANLSGLSKGEIERIWLPFWPWIACAAAALDRPRVWLALQATTAIAIETFFFTHW